MFESLPTIPVWVGILFIIFGALTALVAHKRSSRAFGLIAIAVGALCFFQRPVEKSADTAQQQNTPAAADDNVNRVDANGLPPVLSAVVGRNKDAVRTLLSHGADPNAGDRYGVSPLLVASQNEDKELIKLLLSYKADINQTTFGGDTVLIWAVKAKKTEMVRFLVENGADVNQGGAIGNPPLYYARLLGLPNDIVDFLIAHGAKQ